MLAQAGSILDRAYFSADGSACMVVRARVSSGERQVVPPYPGALPARLLLSRENSESPPGQSRRLFWVRASATRGHARSLKSVGFGKVVRACSHLIYLVSVPASRRGKARWRATPLGGFALSCLWHKKGSECGRAGRAGGLASCLVSSWASPPRGETQALDSTRATRLYPLYHQFEECDRQIVLMAPALCFLLGGGGEGE